MGDEAKKISYLKRGGDMHPNWSGDDYREGTTFIAERPKDATPYGYTESARATVELHSPSWRNHYAGPHDYYATDSGRYSTTSAGHEAEQQAKPGDQGTLFHREPGQIYAAFAAKSMRGSIPTLLGLAANEHARQFGDKDAPLPMPSSDLSIHSSRMVKNLKSKGAQFPDNPDNPDADVANRYDWDTTEWMENAAAQQGSHGVKTLDEATVQAGRDTIKSVLRPKPLAQQFGAVEQQPKKRNGQVPGQQTLF